jgi:hypothetical protein
MLGDGKPSAIHLKIFDAFNLYNSFSILIFREIWQHLNPVIAPA